MRGGAVLAVVLLFAAAAVPAKTAPAARPQVTAAVDRTAVWPGDVLRYTVRAVHVPEVELVLDNFKKELLALAPFVVRDVRIQRGPWANGRRAAEIVLLLSTYETGKAELTIPALQVYYFLREPALTGKESTVENVTVPVLKVGLRSTLVPARPAPREVKPIPPQGLVWPLVLLALGAGGLLALAGYLGWRLWRRLQPDAASLRLTREQRQRILQECLTRVRAGVTGGDDARRAAGAIAAELRRALEALYPLPAAALTPDEIEAALVRSNANAALAVEIRTLLAQCEEWQYGKELARARPRAQLAQQAEKILQSPQLLPA